MRFSEQFALQFKDFLEPQVVDNSSHTDYTTPNTSLIASINCAIIIVHHSVACLCQYCKQQEVLCVDWSRKANLVNFVVCENRALWLAAKFPTSRILLQRSDWRCGWPEKFQPPEFCKVAQQSAVVGRKLSNLPNFAASRNGALWLVEIYPTSSINKDFAT